MRREKLGEEREMVEEGKFRRGDRDEDGDRDMESKFCTRWLLCLPPVQSYCQETGQWMQRTQIT
jgi:hypothetical protein